jgi:serine/threonine-protein kinase HipA
MNRRGLVYCRDHEAGVIEETENGFQFTYAKNYLRDPQLPPVSLTLPKRTTPYNSPIVFPCFVALLAEGALAEVQCRSLKLDERDYFGRLLTTCANDVIGSVRIEDISA